MLYSGRFDWRNVFSFVLRHNDDEQFWSNATVEDWAKEMAGMRIITEKYANLTDNSVVGLRSPYLRVGGNNQFTMMEEQAFLYDSSITAPLSNPPLWPYTMYFRMPHRWDQYCVYIVFTKSTKSSGT